jgi:hypothetical protein
MAKRGRPPKQKTEANKQKMVAIQPDVLVALLKEKADNKTKIQGINGEFGSRLKHHVDLGGLDKAAFAFVSKLNSMTTEDRDHTLSSLELYCDIMEQKGIWERHVGDLANMAAEAQKDAETNSDNGDEKAPVSDEQDEEDVRPRYLIEAEKQRLAEEAAAADQIKTNATTLRRGIRKREPEAATA